MGEGGTGPIEFFLTATDNSVRFMLTASEDIAFVCADATLQHWLLHQCRTVRPSTVKIEPSPFMPSGLINSNNQPY